VPRGGLSLNSINTCKINYLKLPQMCPLYHANVPIVDLNWKEPPLHGARRAGPLGLIERLKHAWSQFA
jgi:hypothetical protein